jgi:hypothetical protein
MTFSPLACAGFLLFPFAMTKPHFARLQHIMGVDGNWELWCIMKEKNMNGMLACRSFTGGSTDELAASDAGDRQRFCQKVFQQ